MGLFSILTIPFQRQAAQKARELLRKRTEKDKQVFEVGEGLTQEQEKEAQQIVSRQIEAQREELLRPTAIERALPSPVRRVGEFLETEEQRIARRTAPLGITRRQIEEGAIGAVGAIQDVGAQISKRLAKQYGKRTLRSIGRKVLSEADQKAVENLTRQLSKINKPIVGVSREGVVFGSRAGATGQAARRTVIPFSNQLQKSTVLDDLVESISDVAVKPAAPVARVGARLTKPVIPSELDDLVKQVRKFDSVEKFEKEIIRVAEKAKTKAKLTPIEQQIVNVSDHPFFNVEGPLKGFGTTPAEGFFNVINDIVPDRVPPRVRRLPEVKRPTTTKTRVLAEQRLARQDQQFIESIKRDVTKGLEKFKGKERQRISFLRNIAEFKQGAINDIKLELGIEKPISKMNIVELKQMTDSLKTRLEFKEARGFVPKIKQKGTPTPDISDDVYTSNRVIRADQKGEFSQKLSDVQRSLSEGADKLLAPISTRLKNIDPSLKTSLRKFEFKLRQQTLKDQKKTIPFLKKVKKMDKDDFADYDLALKNGDTKKINALNDKYEMTNEFIQTREVLDDLYKRANQVGFDIGYRKNYFPRMFKDVDDFMEFIRQSEDWGIFDEAIKRKELDIGRDLIEEEKAHLINTMIRGYSGGQITLSKTGSMKNRKIDFITPEMNRFYRDSNSSLMSYIDSVNEAIEARRFFGKQRPVDKKLDQFNNIGDSIGFYVTDLLAKGKITPRQELKLRELLQARFNPKGTSGLVGIYKNMSYIDVMGSPINAITQIGDLAFSIYEGGLGRTAKSIPKGLTDKTKITLEDLGLSDISSEFTDQSTSGRAVDTIFRLVGLNKIDRTAGNILIESFIGKMQRDAIKPSQKFLDDLAKIFGDEAQSVVDDLRRGEITENVKLLAFNKVLDLQPRALSEMPEQYLKGGNGRLLYMLKTWTLKMFDVYRNEVFQVMKKDKKQGLKNLVRLTAALVIMNSTADTVKDLVLGREIDMKDTVVDNLFKLIGFSRYAQFQTARQGLGSTLFEQIVPPAQSIDDLSKDAINLYKDFDKSFDINELRSVRTIPIGGDLYYWWLGKGTKSPTKTKPLTKVKRTGTRRPSVRRIRKRGTSVPQVRRLKKD